MYQLTLDAVTKEPRLDGLNKEIHFSRTWRPEVKITVSAGPVSPEASLHGWQAAALPRVLSPLCGGPLLSVDWIRAHPHGPTSITSLKALPQISSLHSEMLVAGLQRKDLGRPDTVTHACNPSNLGD